MVETEIGVGVDRGIVTLTGTMDSYAKELLRMSALVETCPEVREMDLNPVKVLGSGVRVVDARIRVGRPPAPLPSRRIAY